MNTQTMQKDVILHADNISIVFGGLQAVSDFYSAVVQRRISRLNRTKRCGKNKHF